MRLFVSPRAIYVLVAAIAAVLVVPAGAGAVHLRLPAGLASQHLGASLSELRDQNGDGRDEILIGVPHWSGTGASSGRALIWFGGNALPLSPDVTYTGAPGELFGHSVARVGDLNGDGIDDFAVGAPGADNAGQGAGRVYVFFGGTPLPATADAILEGAPGDSLGWSVSAAGDLNADGRDDLIAGAPTRSQDGLKRGAAYVYYGGSSLGPVPDLVLHGEVAGDRFGWSVTDCGAFTGENADCVAVGAPLNGSRAGIESGAVYVFEGATSSLQAPDAAFDLVLVSGGTAGGRFGHAVRGVGRWSGDSYPDLAASAPWHSARNGRVEIFFGGPEAGGAADRYVTGDFGGNLFGWALAAAGDVTGGNEHDLIIGAPGHTGDGADAGRAYLYPGGSPTSQSARVTLTATGIQSGSIAGDWYGWAVAGGGDFDGDGVADYFVGAPEGNDDNGIVAGYVHVYDSGGGQVPTLLQDWSADWAPDGAVRLLMRLAAGAVQGEAELRITREVRDRDAAGLERQLVHAGPWPADGTWQGLDPQAAAALAGRPADAVLTYGVELRSAGGDVLDLGSQPGPQEAAPRLATALARPYPNPANPGTIVRFRAPAGVPVRCAVHDLRGARVAVLHRGTGTGAWQEVRWDGHGDGAAAGSGAGGRSPAGLYLVRLNAGEEVRVQRVVLAP
ncbi:MAG: integrin alpha [Candidatus Krumholzibacteriia bacterium]